MRGKVIFIQLIFLSHFAMTQVKQVARFEIAQKPSDPELEVFSLETEGLLLVEDSREFENRKRIRKFIQLDTALNIQWAARTLVPEEEELTGYEYSKGMFRLLYTHQQHADLKGSIISLDLRSQSIENDPFNIQLDMKLTHYTTAGSSSIIGGQVGLQPMIAIFDHQTKRSRIVPGFFLSESELIDVRANRNETFSILQIQKKGNEKTMIYRAFDSQGNQLVEDRFQLESEITIQTAMSSSLVHGEVMVAGIYAFGGSGLSTGILSVILNPSGEKKVTYTDFPMLSHFLDYMPEKRSDKIIRNATQRRNAGKSPGFRIAASLHRLDEHPFGFLLSGESFQIPGNSQNTLMNSGPYPYRQGMTATPFLYSNMPWRYGYDPFASTARLISEVRMTNSFAVAFDHQGRYLWDESVGLDQISMPQDVQYSDYVLTHSSAEFIFMTEKGLGHSVLTNSETRKKSYKVHTMTPGEGRSLLYESNLEHTVRRWYSNRVYVYGTQQIRNNQANEEDQKKRVFFINKILIN